MQAVRFVQLESLALQAIQEKKWMMYETLQLNLAPKGLVAWVTYLEDGSVKSPVFKFLNEEQINEIQKRAGAEKGRYRILCSQIKPKVVFDVLGRFRLYFGDRLGLIDKDQHDLLLGG